MSSFSTINRSEELLETVLKDLVDVVLNQEVEIGYGMGWLVRLKGNWKEICRKM